jgi:hypothetical protein
VELEDWKQFVVDMVTEAEEMLAKQLLFQVDGRLPEVNLWRFKDDQEKEDMGYYFATISSVGWDEARALMGKWLISAGDPMGLFGDQDEGGVQEWMGTAVDDYNSVDKQFRILLYLVILFLGEGPPRGTEMMSIKFMNTCDGLRDIFIYLGRFMMVTSYHKSQGITGKQKVGCYNSVKSNFR